jgi:hypothetical protein
MHLSRAHYIDLAETDQPHVLTAAVINLACLAACPAGEPCARTRQPSFVRMLAQPG